MILIALVTLLVLALPHKAAKADGEFVEIDVFPETLAELLIEQPGGVITPNPDLPATDGGYRSPATVFAEYNGSDIQIVLENALHRALAEPPPVIDILGVDECQSFQSSLLTNVVATSAQLGLSGELVQIELTGPVQTIMYGKAGATVGSFDAEIVTMELSGEIPGVGPILIRENSYLSSTGQTQITDIGSGLYHIDSFFDVFTELSVDGGNTWTPATEGVRMELVELQLVSLVGPAEVHTFFEGPNEGDAVDDDSVPDGRDEVRTEIKSMDLSGMIPMGPVQVSVRTDHSTEGEIEELVNNTPERLDLDPFHPGDANSYFDIWPEITIGGQAFITAGPIRIETTIHHKPPQDGEWYLNPLLPCVELIDPITGVGMGIFVWGEIHQIQVIPTLLADFGDAPDPTYPTLLASNGASHQQPTTLFLGSAVDGEPDGQPSAFAEGDDSNGVDDEDGVTFSTIPLIPGNIASVDVVASSTGLLDAWLDFNSDGNWSDAGEQIFTSQPLVAGLNNLSFSVPAGAILGETFTRFRISSDGGLSFDGLASDGEVEDYMIEISTGNQPPVANAGGPYTGIIDTSITCNGSGSYDPDGTIVCYDWDFGDNSTGSGVNPSHIYTDPGIYTVNLTVTDNKGLSDFTTTSATIIEGAKISGTTCEANGSILSGVTVTIDGGASVVSSNNGTYQIIATTTGNHTVTASKAGLRDQTQVIEITDLTVLYTLDFKGNNGLVPNAPTLSYVLACINKWIAPPGDGTDLNLSKVLAVINAWQFPL